MNVDVWKVGEEVVADEDCKENKIVDDSFQAIVERQDSLNFLELKIEIFPHQGQV